MQQAFGFCKPKPEIKILLLTVTREELFNHAHFSHFSNTAMPRRGNRGRGHPPPNISHTSAGGILKHAAWVFYSHLFIFLYISYSVHNFRYHLQGAVHNLSSRIDGDPYLKSLIYHTDHEIPSGGSILDRPLFHMSSVKPIPNASDFSDSIVESKIALPEEGETKFVRNDVETFVILKVLIKEFEWWRWQRKANSLDTLVGVFSITSAFVLLACLFIHAWVYGTIFLKVVDHLVGNERPNYHTCFYGWKIGVRRWTSLLMLMKWKVRGALALLIGAYFFWKVEDLHLFLKVFLRIIFMPFSDSAPWVAGYEWESLGFAVIWFFVDLVACFVFAIDSWLLIVNARRMGAREIFREGYRLLGALFYPAFVINVLEAVIPLVLKMMLGEGSFEYMYLQAVMEVYFKVAWLIFYFSAWQKAGASVGRPYGRREFQDLVDIAAYHW